MYVAEDGGRRTKKTNGGWNYQKTCYHCVECDLAFCGPENSLCWMNHVKYGPPQPDEREKRHIVEYWNYRDAQARAAAAAAAAAAGAKENAEAHSETEAHANDVAAAAVAADVQV